MLTVVVPQFLERLMLTLLVFLSSQSSTGDILALSFLNGLLLILVFEQILEMSKTAGAFHDATVLL